jgi:SAM-dependent methyltransferase
VSLSEPAPEVRDDDWGNPEPGEDASRMRSRELPTEPAPAPEPASVPGSDTPPPSPLALRTIPRPVPRPPTAHPPAQAAGGAADPDSVAVIQPVRIIDVLSDLPAVPGEMPIVALEEIDDDAGLPLRLLADGPTPIDAGEYLRALEAHGLADSAPEVHAEARASRTSHTSIDDLETEPLEEIEVEPRSEVEPASIEEVEAVREPSDDLVAIPAPESVRERMPDSTEEIEPDRDSDSGEEIPIDMLDEQPAVSAPRPPPPPRRPPAMASPDLASYAAAATSTPTPGLAQAPQAPAAPPPPLKQARSGAEPTPLPTEDTPRRKKPWWEELFSEDYIRTMDRIEPSTIRRETSFIEERLGMEKGAVILDLACGNGMHAVEMASRGYSVVGYDLSLAMLARASDEAQERGQKLNFLHGDMREMAFEETFDAVYSWSTSFGYFEEEKNADILVRIRRALRSGGLLLLDMVNRDYVAARQPSLVWFEGEGCVCMDEMSVDFFTSRLKVRRTVMFDDGRSRELDYSIRIYGLHEMGKLLHEAGFKVLEVTGHPAHPGVFFGSESPRLIILAERS